MQIKFLILECFKLFITRLEGIILETQNLLKSLKETMVLCGFSQSSIDTTLKFTFCFIMLLLLYFIYSGFIKSNRKYKNFENICSDIYQQKSRIPCNAERLIKVEQQEPLYKQKFLMLTIEVTNTNNPSTGIDINLYLVKKDKKYPLTHRHFNSKK